MPDRIACLAPGERLVVVEIGLAGVSDALRTADDAARSALLMVTEGLRSPDAILDHLLDDLAELALARWLEAPGWPTVAAPGLADGLSTPWLKAAGKHAAAGRPPRFRRMARAVEFAQLARVADPAGLVLVAEVDPASPARAAPVIQAIEWCASRGAAVVAALPAMPAGVPPFDRILYGAQRVVWDAAPVAARFIASRAHHASAIEQRLEAALRDDGELGPLFACNVAVPLGLERTAPRVDFLWRDGRVVVELDGPEHRGAPKFGADRHRDYELLIAGYLVLRITNEQAETDLPRAVEKIRDVVRLRRGQKGEPVR